MDIQRGRLWRLLAVNRLAIKINLDDIAGPYLRPMATIRIDQESAPPFPLCARRHPRPLVRLLRVHRRSHSSHLPSAELRQDGRERRVKARNVEHAAVVGVSDTEAT